MWFDFAHHKRSWIIGTLMMFPVSILASDRSISGFSQPVLSVDFGGRMSTLIFPQKELVKPVLVVPSGSNKASNKEAKKVSEGIDLSVAMASRLVLIGESHGDMGVKMVLARALKSGHGITHIGLEAMGSDDQGLLDRYLRTGLGEPEISESLRQWGYVPAAYLALIRAARQARVRIVALDLPNDIRDPERVGKYTCSIQQKECRMRDCSMARHIASVIHSGGSKMVVLVGHNHVNSGRLPAHLRDLYGLDSKSFDFRKGYLFSKEN